MRTVRGERSVSPGESVLAAALERYVGSLTAGHRHRVVLEQTVDDGFGGWRDGPHTAGWVERVAAGGLRLRLLDTEAGRTAEALLEDGLLDVALSRDYPAVIRLVDLGADVGRGR